MLREIPKIRQDTPALTRRWFQDDYFDLWTWQSEGGAIVAFQLCYDRQGSERVFSWRREHGYDHLGVEFGRGFVANAAILRADGVFPAEFVSRRLHASAHNLPGVVRSFVFRKIRDYARGRRTPAPGGAAVATSAAPE